MGNAGLQAKALTLTLGSHIPSLPEPRSRHIDKYTRTNDTPNRDTLAKDRRH